MCVRIGWVTDYKFEINEYNFPEFFLFKPYGASNRAPWFSKYNLEIDERNGFVYEVKRNEDADNMRKAVLLLCIEMTK